MVTGCYNYHELDNLAIATAIAIDKDKDEYEVSIMIANSKKAQVSSKEGQSQTTVFSGKGKTISDAILDIDLQTPKYTYLGHLAVVVMSEEVAKEGVNNVVDLLLRAPQSRKKFYFILAEKNKAKDVIKVLSPLESFPSQNIAINLENSYAIQSISTDIRYSGFVSDLIKKGINPVLPSIHIEGKPDEGAEQTNLEKTTPNTFLKLGDIGIFREDKLLGFASKDVSRGINILTNNSPNINLTSPCDDSNIVTRITNFKLTNDVKLVNNEPQISIHISTTGSLQEINCKRNLTDNNTIDELQKMAEKSLAQTIRKGLDAAQHKYKSDVLGYGSMLYRNHASYFNRVEKYWDKDIFPNIDIKLTVDVKLDTKGSLEETVRHEMEESL